MYKLEQRFTLLDGTITEPAATGPRGQGSDAGYISCAIFVMSMIIVTGVQLSLRCHKIYFFVKIVALMILVLNLMSYQVTCCTLLLVDATVFSSNNYRYLCLSHFDPYTNTLRRHHWFSCAASIVIMLCKVIQ